MLFQKYQTLKHTSLQISSFSSGFSLMDAIDGGKHFDIVVLDVIMPGENGIEIAKKLRRTRNDMKIIFLTSSPEYAVASYDVKAQNYLLKPVAEEKFFSAIDSVLAQLDQKDNAGFILFTTTRQYIRILFSRLVYAEAMHKSVTLHLSDGTTVSTVMTFTEFLKLLEDHPDFLQPHRSYVVNMGFIRCVNKNEIHMIDDSVIPLSRNNYARISEQFLNLAVSDAEG